MRRKTVKHNKSQIKQYTAFVPKTVKATKTIGNTIIKNINYFLKSTTKTIKSGTKMLDKRTAKSIRSLTKRRKHH